MSDSRAHLRALPSVDRLLACQRAQSLTRQFSRAAVISAIRLELDACRQRILSAQDTALDAESLLLNVGQRLIAADSPSLRPVINASGVILHTNLGRAPLSHDAIQAMSAVAGDYNTLEYDLDAGKRGSRFQHASDLLHDLTGAEDALVVNNNAASLVLLLSALAAGAEVVISRGQLVEIGGGFRIPDILHASGARLVEVGTTNRTRIADFRAAISDQSAMLLRVHASNFKQLGFVEQPDLRELASCAHEHGILAVDDLGSGTLLDTTRFGLAYEPTIQDSVRAGFDLVCFSGDKLLGGPQAGIIIGKRDLIARLKRHPLARALRVDKLTYAALNATLRHYRRDEALEHVPVWRMISRPLDDLRQMAERWAQICGGKVVRGESAVGGGSLPGSTLPTWLVALESDSPDQLKADLRRGDPPVIARVADGTLLLDPRTVLPDQERELLSSISEARHQR